MSMNMYMINLMNGVEALTEDLNTVEKEVHDNDAELLSIDANLSQLNTRIDDTESNISLIETNKQDKLGVLSNVTINQMSCNQVLIGTSNVITEINTLKTSIDNTNSNKQDILGASSVISLNKLSCNQVLLGFSDVGSEISTLKTSIAQISSNVDTKQDNLVLSSDLNINNMNCSQLLVGDSNIITEINTLKTSIANTDYVDNAISDIDTFINNYIVSPSIDLAGKILTDVSIVNKLYIDQKAQQLWDALNSYHTITDFSLKGIHTIDLSSFDSFTTGIGAYSSVKIASLRYSPRNSNSRHNCFFNTPYRFPSGGAAGFDAMRSYARVYQEGVLKYQSYQPIQYFVGAGGGGTRSGVIFPLQFSVKRNLLNSKEITIEIWVRNDCDDQLQVERTEGTWFTCNEIRG